MEEEKTEGDESRPYFTHSWSSLMGHKASMTSMFSIAISPWKHVAPLQMTDSSLPAKWFWVFHASFCLVVFFLGQPLGCGSVPISAHALAI